MPFPENLHRMKLLFWKFKLRSKLEKKTSLHFSLIPRSRKGQYDRSGKSGKSGKSDKIGNSGEAFKPSSTFLNC